MHTPPPQQPTSPPASRRQGGGTPAAVVLLAAASLLAGCVTEQTTRPVPARGVPYRPGGVAEPADFPAPPPPARAPAAAPTLPRGPIARPVAPDATTVSRVTVAVRPLGPVPYDGVLLPLVSPDGTHLATQTGPPTAWGTVLALPGASPALGTRLRAYRITPQGLSEVVWAAGEADPPGSPGPDAGAMLGRSADVSGFLIEQPTPAGGRRIGRIEWETGRTTWIVDDGPETIAANAVIDADGTLLYARRPPGNPLAELVIRPPGGVGPERVVRSPVESFLYPLPTGRPDIAAAVSLSESGVSVVGLAADPGTPDGAWRVVSRYPLATDPNPALAFQCVAPVPLEVHTGRDGRVLVFSPAEAQVLAFEPRTGAVQRLGSGSLGASRLVLGPERGYLVALANQLVYVDEQTTHSRPGETLGNESRSVPVLAGQHLVKSAGGTRFVLLAPGRPERGGASVPSFDAMLLEVAPPE